MMSTKGTLRLYDHNIKTILAFLRQHAKPSFIVAAVLCAVAAEIYRQLAVPKHLRQFPKFGFFSMIRSFKSLESVYERNDKYVVPFLQQGHQLYIVSVTVVHR